MTDERALLASPGLEGEPLKGVYFFAGEAAGNLHLYTTHPLLADDQHWNSDPMSRQRVMTRVADTNANTVLMSYWSNMPQWSPMALDDQSLRGVLDAASSLGLVIIPVIETGFDPRNPDIPHWEFHADFPPPSPDGPVSRGLIDRLGQLVDLFEGRMHLWARMYDVWGRPRYAVQLLHVWSSLPGTNDASFVRGFANVATAVHTEHQLNVGFLLDVIGDVPGFTASPASTGPLLRAEPSVLAISGFASEVFSGKVLKGQPDGGPVDNNVENLEVLADWKRKAVQAWASRVPVLLDVSNGMDGRFVWKSDGSYFWGDNLEYSDDRWRNWMSQLKGAQVRGITFDTWNGYTEGYAAVPSFEHYDIVGRWLTDLLEPSPRDFNHVHYVDGRATHRVYGAICEKWLALGADRGFGIPTSEESPSGAGRVSLFTDNRDDPYDATKAIYWSAATDAHEVHGLIARAYWSADQSRLGLPITDEVASSSGALSRFEHGRIEWASGDAEARVTYDL